MSFYQICGYNIESTKNLDRLLLEERSF